MLVDGAFGLVFVAIVRSCFRVFLFLFVVDEQPGGREERHPIQYLCSRRLVALPFSHDVIEYIQ